MNFHLFAIWRINYVEIIRLSQWCSLLSECISKGEKYALTRSPWADDLTIFDQIIRFLFFKALLAKLIQATLYTSPVTWAPSASSLHCLGAWPLQHEEPRLLLALLLHAHSFNFSLFVLQKHLYEITVFVRDTSIRGTNLYGWFKKVWKNIFLIPYIDIYPFKHNFSRSNNCLSEPHQLYSFTRCFIEFVSCLFKDFLLFFNTTIKSSCYPK